MSRPPSLSRQRLAAILRRLRDDAGLSTYQLSEVLGWSQSRVTRIERGLTGTTDADITAWANATNAPQAVRDELTDLAYEAWNESHSWRTSHRRGLAERQREMGRTERSCTAIRHFQPESIPGLLQSPSYARLLLEMANITGQQDIDEAVAARMERQQILREPGREFRYILAEGALRWRPGPVEVMAEQRDHLLGKLAALPSMSLAVLPYDQVARNAYIHPFMICDNPTVPSVLVESYAGEKTIYNPDEIAVYEDVFAQLQESALTGDEAVSFIRSVLP